jgi:hypothetical protein
MRITLTKYLLLAYTAVFALLAGTFEFIGKGIVQGYCYHVVKCFDDLLLQMPQEARQILQVFDCYGLKFNRKWGNDASNKVKVALMPLDKIAQFADVVTYEGITKKDRNFEHEILKQVQDTLSGFDHNQEFYINQFNLCGLGNTAFVALNTENEVLSEAAFRIIDKVKDYYSDKKL